MWILSWLWNTQSCGFIYMWGKNRVEDRLTDQCSASSYVDCLPVCSGEKKAESEVKAFNLLIDLFSYPHPCSQVLCSDQNNEFTDTGIHVSQI